MRTKAYSPLFESEVNIIGEYFSNELKLFKGTIPGIETPEGYIIFTERELIFS